MLDPWLPLVFATALALLFGMAAQHQLGLLKNKRFAAQLQAYGLLPEPLVSPLARGLTWLELAIAFALLMPLLRGRSDIDCGCGDAPQKPSW